MYKKGAMHSFFKLIIFMASILTISVQADITKDTNKDYQDGLKYYKSGDIKAALASFEQAFAKVPDSSEYAYNVANCYFKLTNFVSARSLCESALRDLKMTRTETSRFKLLITLIDYRSPDYSSGRNLMIKRKAPFLAGVTYYYGDKKVPNIQLYLADCPDALAVFKKAQPLHVASLIFYIPGIIGLPLSSGGDLGIGPSLAVLGFLVAAVVLDASASGVEKKGIKIYNDECSKESLLPNGVDNSIRYTNIELKLTFPIFTASF